MVFGDKQKKTMNYVKEYNKNGFCIIDDFLPLENYRKIVESFNNSKFVMDTTKKMTSDRRSSIHSSSSRKSDRFILC